MHKRFVIAVVAGTITMLLVGFILYGIVFAQLFREGALTIPGVMKKEPDILWIVAGQAGFAVFVALVVSWRNATSFVSGATTGMIVGFLMAVGYDFAQYGTSNLWTLKATLLDPFITALLVGSGGGVIGLVLGHDSDRRS